MTTFLTRKGIVYHLDKIVEEANSELVLISPYIKADDETKNLLKNKTRTTAIHVIYGKKELKPAEKSFLDSLGIRTSFLKSLHAKCYLNANEALLTSMNLYQFLSGTQRRDGHTGIEKGRRGTLQGDIRTGDEMEGCQQRSRHRQEGGRRFLHPVPSCPTRQSRKTVL